MASLYKERQHGRQVWRVSFYDKDGTRRKIRLGDMAKKAAEAIALKVQTLADYSSAGLPPDAELSAWLAKIGDELAGKLAKVGLIAQREAAAAADTKLAAFLDAYANGRTDVKAGTKLNFLQARDYLVEYFGEDRDMRTISAGDADDWRIWLKTQLGDNTLRRHCGRAKQFFRAAVRKRLIADNPFGDMKECEVRANRDRDYFITRDQAAKVLAACPDLEWQLLFALSRYGGLRCPSEHLGLRWGDIDWERGRMTVRSPKTEHHEGKGSRTLPIFPELRPYLEAAWDAAAEGAEFVIARHRHKNINLRTQLERVIERAGLKTWPKLFQNLRASRATELATEYPAHVAADWLGHSRLVAAEHYWQVTDADFAKALVGQGGGAQVGAATDRDHTTTPASIGGKPADCHAMTDAGEVSQTYKVPPA